MDQNLSLIQNRRDVVEQEIARHRNSIAVLENELGELEMAERVVTRLSGGGGLEAQPNLATTAVELPAARAREKRTLPEMIITILQEKLADGINGMEPKFATKIIRDRWDRNVAGTYVSTTFWRMWKGNLLHKDEGSSVYRLPEKKEPADMLPGEASTGSLFNTQAKGREAVPGGGT